MLRFIFKLLVLLSLLLTACEDIPRDNILDPKNPSGTRPQIISLEAFVNTDTLIPFDYNFQLLEALNQLESKYEHQIVILEYHRNVQNYVDPDHSIENEALYTKYVDYAQPDSKGVPDVFINGTTARVQGAYDATGSTKIRLEQAIEPLLIRNSSYAIEPKINKISAGYEISTIIARLGNSSGMNLLVKAVIISQDDNEYQRRVVKLISKSNVITEIEPGEIKEVNFPVYQKTDQNPESIIFFITSDDEVRVYQTLKVDLQ